VVAISGRIARLSRAKACSVNHRVFLLIAATAFFGLIWSSDRRYQEEYLLCARTVEMARRDAEPSSEQITARPPAAKSLPIAVRRPMVLRGAVVARAAWNGRTKNTEVRKSADLPTPRIAEQKSRDHCRALQPIYFARRSASLIHEEEHSWQNIALNFARDLLRRLEAASGNEAALPKVETE
jgi:hypothetical protein